MITLADKLLLVPGTKSKAYVEFVSSTAMTITPKYTNSRVTLQYSLNGTSWTTIATGATTPSTNIIYFRGQATRAKSLYNSASTTNAWTFLGATNLECNGKLDRLLQDTLGDDNDVLTIGNNCFSNMFYNQTSLISVDDDCLPATTLAADCYRNMFQWCGGLITAPMLPATTLAANCYQNMFQNCPGLTTAPSLPATTLATNCYRTMFQNCSGLTTLPKLQVLVLQSGCYRNMFYSCTKIKLSTTKTGIYDTAYRIPTSGTGTTATNALNSMFAGTGGTFTGTPTINTTYYTENTPI